MISVLTSPRHHEIAAAYEQSGRRVFIWPELDVAELNNNFSLDEAIDHLFGYDWLILKNDRAAEFFLRRLIEVKHHTASLDEVQVLAIGEATVAKLVDAQVHVDIALDRHTNNSLVASLRSYLGGEESLASLNLLFPSANIIHENFEAELEERGARIDCVAAYRTTLDARRMAELNALLAGGGIDAVIFRDSESVEEFARVFDSDDLPRLLRGISIICDDEAARAKAAEFGLKTYLTSEIQDMKSVPFA
ncbi:MAG TPA: uroporphyrinogen-III synthase [Pyrinomonadaceae bacterium]|nr:uroporphyrinogen-III synthase [Pyrinomonadaceae bacterium]